MSDKFKLNKADLISIMKSIALATAGFVLTYIIQQVLPSLDLGKQAWMIPLITVALNALRRWITGS